MAKFLYLLPVAGIAVGQLIKIPITPQSGVTILDLGVFILCLFGFLKYSLILRKPPMFILAALLFTTVALISLIFTPLKLNASEYLVSFFYIIRFFFYILLGWFITSGALPQLKRNAHKILLYSGVILAVLGLLQFVVFPNLEFLERYGWDPHYFRTVSTFLDPNFVGAFFVLTLIYLWDKQRLLFFIVYLALVTTFSRGAYLMFFISSLSLLLIKKSKTILFGVTILFILLLLSFYFYTLLISQPRNIDRTQSAQYRLSTWQQGWQLFQLHPVLGVGFNTYQYALRNYNLADEKFIASHGSSGNDSSLLFVLATTGILGFISYLFFIFSLFKMSHKRNLILIVGLIGLLGHSIFANSLFYPPILLMLILLASSDTKD